MSFNYNTNNNQGPQQFYGGQQTTQFQQPNQFQQNVQPLFPQPQGNVYNINSTLEVANVPVGAGISVALCLNEGFMYIKTMQNGNPMFWAYRILPYDTSKTQEEQPQKEEDGTIEQQFKKYDDRFEKLENQVTSIQKTLKKDTGEWKM